MFPINILIVSIFRHTRPRESGCCKCKRETPDTTGPMYLSQAGTQVLNDDVAFEAVMKVCLNVFFKVGFFLLIFREIIIYSSQLYLIFFSGNEIKKLEVLLRFFFFLSQEIKGITQLLSKTVKNNTLCTELGPKQQTDINAALSVVEGLIKQGNESEPQQPGESLIRRVQSVI